MTSFATPKEQQTAYERWEMSSFVDDLGQTRTLKPKSEKNISDANVLSKILENARKEAFEKGIQEGFTVGMAKAREQAGAEKQAFMQLMQNFNAALEKKDEQIAEDVLALALDIAKSMLKIKLNVDPSIILPLVMDAIHYLPSVQKPARILVHHDDARILRDYLAEELLSQEWQVQEDSNIERGGCLVETGANQIDATNALRWKRITEALAQKNDWLLP
ncbi:MAG TPA: FliH/SctL family protein [Methylotenera sp.]|nr:FliH/SctL family protein [Methylotenera sp.]HPH04978.1 FliH/SctL family protein [Methylotenera sp.]HPN00240.1 FliH/SctL family protein [Methylotenera sp.]